jgi:uncharacterized protein (TIGR02246 family)
MSRALKILMVPLAIVLLSCQPTSQRLSEGKRKAIEEAVAASADGLAAAISRLDAEGVKNFFTRIDDVEYISENTIVPYDRLKKTFESFFGGLQEMNFVFEKKAVWVLSPDDAVLSGWAHYSAVAETGQKTDERAIFTIIYRREANEWCIIHAHKSLLRSFPRSETSKARPRLSRFCQGNGVDLGYGGDPIVPSAITMDLPTPYTKLGDHPQNLPGDARDLYWFKNNALDYVYASHLLEDFPPQETVPVLREWLRVIKVGGFLVLYGPDEPAYRAHCKKKGQVPNAAHKMDNFGLRYLKGVLERNFPGQYSVVHETELIDVYCFDLVIRKLK